MAKDKLRVVKVIEEVAVDGGLVSVLFADRDYDYRMVMSPQRAIELTQRIMKALRAGDVLELKEPRNG